MKRSDMSDKLRAAVNRQIAKQDAARRGQPVSNSYKLPAEIVIVLDLPPRELSPNTRTHWRRKAAAVKAYRAAACLAATLAANGKAPRWAKSVADVTFFWPDARRRDIDNAMSSIKAAWDGLVDARILADDSGLVPRPSLDPMQVDPETPRVQIVVKERP